MPNKDPSVSKMHVVRSFLDEHPDASPQDVADALAARGIAVAPAFAALVVQAFRDLQAQPVPQDKMPPGHVSFEEGVLFYKLYAALCSYANSKLNVLPNEHADPEQFNLLPPEMRLKVRDALHAQPELIEQCVQENPARLTTEELTIVAGWKHAVVGDFYVFRYLKHYTVFLADTTPLKAYGVLALATPFKEMFGPRLPARVKGVLLPINGRITYDGLLPMYPFSFGPGIRRMMNDSYNTAKEAFGIITSLGPGARRPSCRGHRSTSATGSGTGLPRAGRR
jgi:hypothetical protein